MKTETKKATKKEELDVHSALKAEFEAIKNTPVTRKVTLKYRLCDDCNCSYRDISRTVPYDSKMKDGDKVHGELKKGDKYV